MSDADARAQWRAMRIWHVSRRLREMAAVVEHLRDEVSDLGLMSSGAELDMHAARTELTRAADDLATAAEGTRP